MLIDEACQASELATLQPLIKGATKVVLVGDPQQLPATILSAKGKEVRGFSEAGAVVSRGGCADECCGG